MKTALCIYGLYRELDRCIRSWKFLNHMEYDVYFSTYDHTYERNTGLGIDIFEPITGDQILNNFPQAGNIEINLEQKDNLFLNPLHNSDKMLYHWKKCFDMLGASGIEYNRVFLIRPDLFFENSAEFILPTLDCSSDNIIYSGRLEQHPPPTYLGIVDTLLIGNVYTLGKIIRDMNYIFAPKHYFEYYLAKFLINNDIYSFPLGDKDVRYTVVRSNARQFIDNNITDNFAHDFMVELGKLTEKWAIATNGYEDRKLPYAI